LDWAVFYVPANTV